MVAELLFCLPMSNGELECIFSQLKVINIEKHSCLGEDRLDQLLRISADASPGLHFRILPSRAY